MIPTYSELLMGCAIDVVWLVKVPKHPCKRHARVMHDVVVQFPVLLQPPNQPLRTLLLQRYAAASIGAVLPNWLQHGSIPSIGVDILDKFPKRAGVAVFQLQPGLRILASVHDLEHDA